MAVVQSECATFVLLRRRNQDDDNDTIKAFATEAGNIWFDALSYFLSSSLTPPDDALDSLAGNVHRLDAACFDKPDATVAFIRRWFWEERAREVLVSSGSVGTFLSILTRVGKVVRSGSGSDDDTFARSHLHGAVAA